MITTNKNKKDLTIDLKGIIAKDYLNSKKTNIMKLKTTLVKIVAIVGVFLYLLVSFGTYSGFVSINKTSALESILLTDLQNRENARLERLTICNKNIKLLKNYYLNRQDIGTRCATIMTLSKDKIPVKYIMQDIHTPAKAKEFWNIYGDIKKIRIKNGIKAQTRLIYIKKQVSKKNTFDINKLAYSVAMAETKNCGLNYGSAKRNNCFGIMTWKRGFREFKSYKTKEDSYKDFKRIWSTYYKGMPNYAKAKKWTGNDRVNNWLKIVKFYYYK